MGSYGIGPARIVATAVEQRHDADGIVWPWALAPFHVHLVPVATKDAAQLAARLTAPCWEVPLLISRYTRSICVSQSVRPVRPDASAPIRARSAGSVAARRSCSTTAVTVGSESRQFWP